MTDAASSTKPWPPMIYGGATLVGLALHALRPLPLWTGAQALSVGAAALVAACGAACFIAASGQFRRAGTPVAPMAPTTAIVSGGIYRWSRNPIYLGFSLILLGFAIGLREGWFLVALPFAVYGVTKLAIEPEERYLEARFGAAYLDYKAKTARWLGAPAF